MKILKTITIEVRDNLNGRTFTETELEEIMAAIETRLFNAAIQYGNSKDRPTGIELSLK